MSTDDVKKIQQKVEDLFEQMERTHLQNRYGWVSFTLAMVVIIFVIFAILFAILFYSIRTANQNIKDQSEELRTNQDKFQKERQEWEEMKATWEQQKQAWEEKKQTWERSFSPITSVTASATANQTAASSSELIVDALPTNTSHVSITELLPTQSNV